MNCDFVRHFKEILATLDMHRTDLELIAPNLFLSSLTKNDSKGYSNIIKETKIGKQHWDYDKASKVTQL